MSEEFKPIRITLSDEAFDRLDQIMKKAKFRSYSSTVEECIRVVHDIIDEIYTVAGVRDSPDITISGPNLADAMMRIIGQMSRFTGRRPAPKRNK